MIYYDFVNLMNIELFDMFSDIELYEKIDKDICVNTILDKVAELQPLVFDARFMKHKIEIFFKRYYNDFKVMYDIMNKEYDELLPVNYVDVIIDDGNNENKISAYNENDYQPSSYATGYNKRTIEHKGNNGAKNLTELIKSRVNFTSENNIYNYIAEKFKNELCVRVMYR